MINKFTKRLLGVTHVLACGNLCYLPMACDALNNSLTPPFMATFEVSRCDLPVSHAYVHKIMTIGFSWTFSFLFFLSLFSSGFSSLCKKIKGVLSFVFCIKFNTRSFDYYLFFLLSFLVLIFFFNFVPH